MDGLILLGFAAGAALLFMVMNGNFSPSYDISSIKEGDSKQFVIALLGKPHEVRASGSSCAETLVWTVPFKTYISIDFNERGEVTRKYRSGPPV